MLTKGAENMEELKIDVEKALDGVSYRDGIAQVNLDGTPITDKRYIRLEGNRFGIFHNGGKIKEIDHQPTEKDLNIYYLHANSESVRKGNQVRKKRKTAQESLKFLLSCSAEPKEAREIIHVLTGGEWSDTIKNFFDPEQQDGDESDLTQYDLINLAMITSAKNGDTKAAQYVRDTIGDKLADKVEMDATFTEGDKSLLEKVQRRLELLSAEYLPNKEEKTEQ